ncbi:MAG: hypothetical protein R3E66_05655 [bacterium]
MNILVAHHVETPADVAIASLARVLGLSAYDARLKVNVASPGPVVLATHEDQETLEVYADTLCADGVPSFVVGPDDLLSPFVARKLEFGPDGLHVEARDGQHRTVSLDNVHAIIRGIGITTFETTETESTRKLAMGRAIATGGLLLTKKVETTRTQTRDARAGFCFVVVGNGLPPVLLSEDELQYDGLGAAMKATRSLNFSYVCDHLKSLCPNATYDTQLLNRARQVQILGPKLAPESYLDWAVTALMTSLNTRK